MGIKNNLNNLQQKLMGSSTDFLLGEDLDAFHKTPECASMVIKTFSEMHSEKLETHSCSECSEDVRVCKNNENKN